MLPNRKGRTEDGKHRTYEERVIIDIKVEIVCVLAVNAILLNCLNCNSDHKSLEEALPIT